ARGGLGLSGAVRGDDHIRLVPTAPPVNVPSATGLCDRVTAPSSFITRTVHSQMSPFTAPPRDPGPSSLPPHVCSARTPEGAVAMPTDDADDLVPFQDVWVIETTGQALLCRIGNRTVWLPRRHISGKLWCSGDRGKLFVRRWLARDRQLIDQRGEPISPLAPSDARPRPPGRLHSVR